MKGIFQTESKPWAIDEPWQVVPHSLRRM